MRLGKRVRRPSFVEGEYLEIRDGEIWHTLNGQSLIFDHNSRPCADRGMQTKDILADDWEVVQ